MISKIILLGILLVVSTGLYLMSCSYSTSSEGTVAISTNLSALELSEDPREQCARGQNRTLRSFLSRRELGNHIVIQSRKAIFCFIPRVGSSSWTRLALKPEGFSINTTDWFAKVGKEGTLKRKTEDLRSQILQDPCYFRFVFVRDPFSRLLSAWMLMNSTNPQKRYNVTGTYKGIQRVSSNFETFVRTQAFAGPVWNKHWRPLTSQCGLDGSFDYHFIGRWEDKKIWTPLLIKRLGLEKEASSGWGPPTDRFEDGKIGSMRTNSFELLDQYYTVELLDIVAQAYEADLKALHYNNFYHSLRQRLLSS